MSLSSKPQLVVAALVQKSFDPRGPILLVRRGPDMSGAGQWEFPGGKVEEGEKEVEALVREIEEELSLQVTVGKLLGEGTHHYPNKSIHLKVYWTEILSGDLFLTEHDAHRWVEAEQIIESDLSEADRPFLEKILNF
ncbi:MutT/NUDIX family hydrolase /pyrophosphatase [Bdellovibrio bacteriovorus W]|nr:MutT/NUDIX family hydrolase /pyrophosphatase [Bdellovibrio bacteriovorus W]